MHDHVNRRRYPAGEFMFAAGGDEHDPLRADALYFLMLPGWKPSAWAITPMSYVDAGQPKILPPVVSVKT